MRRGDIFRIRPLGGQGHAQRGAQFWVIIQTDALLRLSTVIVSPTSKSAQPASFRPRVVIEKEHTHVLIDQLAALDVSRLGKQVGTLTLEELWAVDDAIRTMLAI
ncbi:MAG: type II toxin-antitoxin system PemK/MazF family toxin [Ferrimicrobium sp.]